MAEPESNPAIDLSRPPTRARLKKSSKDFRRQVFAALIACEGNCPRAAAEMGVTRQAVWMWLHKYADEYEELREELAPAIRARLDGIVDKALGAVMETLDGPKTTPDMAMRCAETAMKMRRLIEGKSTENVTERIEITYRTVGKEPKPNA